MSRHQITAATTKSEVNAAASRAVCGDGEQRMQHFQSANQKLVIDYQKQHISKQ